MEYKETSMHTHCQASTRRIPTIFFASAALCGAVLVLVCIASGHRRVAALLGHVDADHFIRPDSPVPIELANPLMKHLVIDKVYFPKNREDAGVAAVHGWMNGNYVEGNLQIQRTAKYNAEDGSWSGVPNPPPRLPSAYKPQVEGLVAKSIRAAMKSLLSPKKPALRLSTMGADPDTALTNEIARAAHLAVDEVLSSNKADVAIAKLKARRAQSFLKTIKKKGQQLHAQPAPHHVKTLQGCTCRKTYVFQGKVHHGCIREGRERAWCYTNANCGLSEFNGKSQLFWDHCEHELVRTRKGCCFFITIFTKALLRLY